MPDNINNTNKSNLIGYAILSILFAIYALARWSECWHNSLWIDEAATYWLINSSFSSMFARSTQFTGNSLTYNSLLWVVNYFNSAPELLRIVSLVFLGGCIFSFYYLVLKHSDSITALLATLIIFLAPELQLQSIQIRPYTFTLCFSILSLISLERFLKQTKVSNVMAYILCSVITIYGQLLYAGILGVHIFYCILFYKYDWQRFKKLLFAITTILCLSLPNFYIVALATRDIQGSILEFTATISSNNLALAGLLLVALVLALLPYQQNNFKNYRLLLLGIFWTCLPSAQLNLLSYLTLNETNYSRYSMWAIPGAGLALSSVLQGCLPKVIQLIPAVVLTGYLLIVAVFFPQKFAQGPQEDWKSAVVTMKQWRANSKSTVLLYAARVENSLASWLNNPEKVQILNSVSAAYPFEAEIYALPLAVNFPRTAPQIIAEISDDINHSRPEKIYLIARETELFKDVQDLTEQSLKKLGYRVNRQVNFKGVILVELLCGFKK